MTPNQSKRKGMQLALDLAWERLEGADPVALAARSGARPLEGHQGVLLRYLAWEVAIDLEEHRVVSQETDLTLMERVLILRYLVLCDRIRPVPDWISLRELPGGRNYLGPFRGRTTHPLEARFGQDRDAFESASRALRGERLSFGDSAFLFRLLPAFWMGLVLNMADDEFEAEVTILFDSAVARCFTTEDCVAAGQVLSRRLLREAG
ncbi:MAG: DUF3786 domain-containing protein [Anaerolineae bacterium]|nr:DUF3786 domain-containing protein [Anaerolineae bacterium]